LVTDNAMALIRLNCIEGVVMLLLLLQQALNAG